MMPIITILQHASSNDGVSHEAFCVLGAWSATPTDYNNFTHGDCLCPSNTTGGMCQPGYYCPQGSLEPTLCEEGSYCATTGKFYELSLVINCVPQQVYIILLLHQNFVFYY
jgi:hypothetical protein